MDGKGLKTKLNWRFRVDDLDIPEMNFESDEPKPKRDTEIKVVSKKKNRDKKQTKLF